MKTPSKLPNKKILVFALLFLVGGLGFVEKDKYFYFDNYFEISKNIDIFGRLYREVNANYVDEIEPNKFIRTGIDAMLRSLDPYTNFIGASEVEDYRFMSTGQYGGVGAIITKRKGKIIVNEPYEDSPAQKAGLMAGDEIQQIDNENILETKFENIDVRNLLRGQPKTKVKIVVKRMGQKEPLTFMVERDEIKVKNVPYFGMVNNNIGYISLSGFTKDAANEVKHALEQLKEKNKDIKGVILDVRGNPGGLLFEAIEIANLFVPKNEKIVETKGRMESSLKVYTAKSNPVDMEIPVTVLVNGRSASASEIVSGVIQDLDRGVIIGRRSYGKGLVQTTRPLSYNSQVKITTAKYYTPSGRCIQAIDYTNRDEDGHETKIADSLKKEFKTKGGRSVFDGGGIEPDIKVADTEYHKVSEELVSQGIIFDFATKFKFENPTIASAKEFKISDKIYNDFVAFVAQNNFKYETKTEKQLEELKKMIKKDNYFEDVKSEITALENDLLNHKKEDVTKFKEEIIPLLQREIVTRYYFQSGAIENSFGYDKDVVEAVNVLSNPEKYKKILKKM